MTRLKHDCNTSAHVNTCTSKTKWSELDTITTYTCCSTYLVFLATLKQSSFEQHETIYAY
jgi:hypothetical protein